MTVIDLDTITAEDRAILIAYLDRIDGIIDQPDHWTREVGARNASGERCNPLDAAAVCWCLTGAAWKVTDQEDRTAHQTDHRNVMMCFRRALDRMGHPITTGEYNDSTDFTRVKLLIQAAREAVDPAEAITLQVA